MLAIGLVIIAAIIGAFGPVFIKLGTADLKFNLKSILNFHLIAGLFFYGLSVVIFIAALRLGEVSVLYPVISTTYIWVALLSVKYLNEKMNRNKWVGVALIIVGVIMISIS